MRRSISLILLAIFTTSSLYAADSTLARKFSLVTEDNRKITVEYKQIVREDGSTLRDSRYIAEGKLLSEIHEEFLPSGVIQSENSKDYICGREDSLHREGSNLVGTYRNGWGEKIENFSASIPSGATFGSGIINTINNSLDILKSGGRVDLKFYVPEKTDWFTLRIEGWDDVMFNGIPAKKITIEPVSFFLKLFVKNSYYIVDPNTKMPFSFSGTFAPVTSDCKPVRGILKFSP